MSSIPRFYVYALARPIKKEWKIFYIGKGQNRRVFHHEKEARSGHNCYKCNVIRKVWREGGEIQRYILLTTNDEQEALEYEKEMIALHGRENLTNCTDGGDGVSNPPEEVRRKIGAAHKGKPGSRRGAKASEETRAKMSAAQKGKSVSPDAREKIRKALMGRKRSPEAIEKSRRSNIGKKMSAEFCAGLSARFKGRVVPEEQRQRIRQTLKEKAPWKGKKHTPESIQKMREVQSARADAKAKDYECIASDGSRVIFRNLKVFCSEHDLDYRGVQRAIYTNKTYKGMRFNLLE
jgi:hypothetical protein